MTKRIQTHREEQVNGISHLFGILFCLIGMPFLIAKANEHHNFMTLTSVIVFGIGMLMVYSFSTLYHLVQNKKRKQLLKIADHISIYYLIAGTYSPLMIAYLNRSTALIFLGIMWLIALLGTFFKIINSNRFKKASVVMYLLMGWMIVFVIKPLWGIMPLSVFLWILAGGISYSVGVYFYVNSYKKYFHAVWHFFVLLGTVFHYIAVLKSL
ncbi:PAQR family membrane homeostasis protein TrhA [Flavobacterium gilvum]|uniref:Hemolysin D n=1 Tax=Flavobacterium gilvum TaxID=1492737 RepID=A0AAC9I7N9_9FLAO|nr:hemolysin III family protein [Flavobacterium gilvum]AOW09467.1 hypothetical protein EM308_08115 [Flavobacterium gilvum]KFC60818.1 hypothetical protein FEM08_03770 [Flavobacterium gilvum]